MSVESGPQATACRAMRRVGRRIGSSSKPEDLPEDRPRRTSRDLDEPLIGPRQQSAMVSPVGLIRVGRAFGSSRAGCRAGFRVGTLGRRRPPMRLVRSPTPSRALSCEVVAVIAPGASRANRGGARRIDDVV